jgi:hypothetical protein
MFGDTAIQTVNGSPMFAGIMMILINVGSRYITHEMSDNDEEYRQNILLRRLAVFAVCFVGTRDVILSTLLTAGYVVLATGLFRGKGDVSREGMANPDRALRASAGLMGQVQSPAYDPSAPLLFH